MRNLFLKVIFFTGLFLFSYEYLSSQFIEDALRFSKSNTAFSPRVGALGVSYYGFADDASTVLFNPAGLALVHGYELGLGLNFNSTDVETNYLGQTKTESLNDLYFSNVQFALPFEIPIAENEDINYTFGFAYFLENNFDADYKFSAYNPNNTLIAQQADARSSWVYKTWLTDSSYNTKVQNNMEQVGRISETGGLHNLVVGVGVDLTDNFAVGGSLVARVGSYDYYRVYTESDIYNVHNEFEVDDVNEVRVTDKINQSVGSVLGIFGVQFRLEDYLRIGITVKTPCHIFIDEDYKTMYEVEYDDNDKLKGQTFRYSYDGRNEYTVTAPFEFSLAASTHFNGLILSLATSYQNAAALKFGNDDNYSYNYYYTSDIFFYDCLNDNIKDKLKKRLTFGIGAEYRIPTLPLYVRASYTRVTSPYKTIFAYPHNEAYDSRNIIGAGCSIVLAKNLTIDAFLTYTSMQNLQAVYGSVEKPELFSFYTLDYSIINSGLGFRYRF